VDLTACETIVHRMIAATIAETGIPSPQLIGRCRHPRRCHARYALWAALQHAGLSNAEIGNQLDRDRAAIRRGARQADPDLTKRIIAATPSS